MDTSTVNGHIAELHNQKLSQSLFWCQRNRDLLPHTVGFLKFWPTLKAPGVWRQQNISKSLYGSQTSLCYINSFTLHRDLAGRRCAVERTGGGKKRRGWKKLFFLWEIRGKEVTVNQMFFRWALTPSGSQFTRTHTHTPLWFGLR